MPEIQNKYVLTVGVALLFLVLTFAGAEVPR